MNLLIILILAAICGLAMCGGDSEWDEYAMQCSQKHNVKVEQMREAFRGKIKEADVTNDMKCFSLCMGQMGKIIKDGALHPQGLEENISSPDDKEKLAKMKSECNIKGTDDCDTAFKVISCISKYKNDKM